MDFGNTTSYGTAPTYLNATVSPTNSDIQSFFIRMCFKVNVFSEEVLYSLPDAVVWFSLSAVSFFFNAIAALYFISVKTGNQLQDTLNANLFIFHVLFGTTVHINFGFVYIKDQCISRTIAHLGTLLMTICSVVTLTLVAYRQLKKLTKIGGLALITEVPTIKKVLSTAIVWVCCIIVVLIKFLNPSTYAPIVIIFLFSLLLFTLYMLTSRALKQARRQFTALASSEEKEAKMARVRSCDDGMKILFALQISTAITWLPACVITLLARIGVDDSIMMNVASKIFLKFLFLPPILDPLFLFWSSARFRRKMKNYLVNLALEMLLYD